MEGHVSGKVNFATVSTVSQTWTVQLETPDPYVVRYLLGYAQYIANTKDYALTSLEETSTTTLTKNNEMNNI